MEFLTSINWVDFFLWCLVVVLIGVGIAGTIIPALPGHCPIPSKGRSDNDIKAFSLYGGTVGFSEALPS